MGSRVVVQSGHTTRALRIGRVRSHPAASPSRTYAAVASMSAQVNYDAVTVTEATPLGSHAKPERSHRYQPHVPVDRGILV